MSKNLFPLVHILPLSHIVWLALLFFFLLLLLPAPYLPICSHPMQPPLGKDFYQLLPVFLPANALEHLFWFL